MTTVLEKKIKESFPLMPRYVASLIAEVVDILHWKQSECIEDIEYDGLKLVRPDVWRLYFKCKKCGTEITVLYNDYYKKIYEIGYMDNI